MRARREPSVQVGQRGVGNPDAEGSNCLGRGLGRETGEAGGEHGNAEQRVPHDHWFPRLLRYYFFRFAAFFFVSMLAYSAQDLILEPFAGTIFRFTPGESTKLAGVQHGGVLIGMVLIAEGFGVHVPKGYIYAAMAFSALVEGLNMMSRASAL